MARRVKSIQLPIRKLHMCSRGQYCIVNNKRYYIDDFFNISDSITGIRCKICGIERVSDTYVIGISLVNNGIDVIPVFIRLRRGIHGLI